MRIHAFIMVWNRYNTIHLTIQHYRQFCEKITILDNFSNDGTWEIAESLGCECRLFGREGVLDDAEYVKIKNSCWKKSDADWVIVVDDDEILWHPFLTVQLKLAQDSGATIIQPKGFAVFSNDMPQKEWTELMEGVPNEKYDKLCCFNPKKIEEINYVPGCHEAKPKGQVRIVNKCHLLHYANVGGAQRMIDRHQLYAKRLSDWNKRWKCGIEYTFSPESKREWFEDFLRRSGPLLLAG